MTETIPSICKGEAMEFDWSNILKPHSFQITEAELSRFENTLPSTLPLDYRRFLLKFNGGKITKDHNVFVPSLSCEIFVNCLHPLVDPDTRGLALASGQAPSLGGFH